MKPKKIAAWKHSIRFFTQTLNNYEKIIECAYSKHSLLIQNTRREQSDVEWFIMFEWKVFGRHVAREWQTLFHGASLLSPRPHPLSPHDSGANERSNYANRGTFPRAHVSRASASLLGWQWEMITPQRKLLMKEKDRAWLRTRAASIMGRSSRFLRVKWKAQYATWFMGRFAVCSPRRQIVQQRTLRDFHGTWSGLIRRWRNLFREIAGIWGQIWLNKYCTGN